MSRKKEERGKEEGGIRKRREMSEMREIGAREKDLNIEIGRGKREKEEGRAKGRKLT